MSTAHVLRLTFAISCLIPGATRAQVPTDLGEAMRAWDQALVKTDIASWNSLTADDFTVVLADGTLMTKAQALAHFRAQRATTPQPLFVVDGRVVENAVVFTAPTPSRIGPVQQEEISRYDHVYVRRGVRPLNDGDARVLEIWVKYARGWRVAAVQYTSVKR